MNPILSIMIALDLNLEKAIGLLDEVSDGVQDTISPNDAWAKNHFDLIDRQHQAVQTGAQSVDTEILQSIENLVRRPFFQWIISALHPSDKAPEDLTGIFYEISLNALTANRTISEAVDFSVLKGERGVLMGVANSNINNFDPHSHVKQKRGYFLSEGTKSEERTIQRGRGFQSYSEDRRVCVCFDNPCEDQLFTGVFIPFSLRSYDLVSKEFRHLYVEATARYLALGEEVAFDFEAHSNGGHRPPRFPDMSDQTREALRQKLSESKPEALAEYERIVKISALPLDPLFRYYLEPEKYLL